MIGRLAHYAAILAFALVIGAPQARAENASVDTATAVQEPVAAPSAEPPPPAAEDETSVMVAENRVAETTAETAPPPQTAPRVMDAPAAPANPGDVMIYVIVGYFHTDVLIPRSAFKASSPLVKAAVDHAPEGDWIIVGWGPWWWGREEPGGPFHPLPVRMMVGLGSLIVPQPNSVVRIAAMDAPGPAPGEEADYRFARPLYISPANLDRLIARVNKSFKRGPDGGPILGSQKWVAKGAARYQSKEIYHLAHECNQWTGEVLRAGGISTPYILNVFSGSVYMNLKMSGAFKPAAPAAAPSTPAR